MRQLPPAATALIIAKQKAELEITREVPPPEPLVVRPVEPPPPPLAESKQIPRGIDGVPLPPPTGIQTWREPAKEHNWSGGTPQSPSWLNGGSNGEKTCSVCGVTQISSFIQADQAGFGYTYRDADGCFIRSMEPLQCPVFIGNKPGNIPGAILDNRGKVRVLNNEMHEVKYKVDGISERMDRLERENTVLREALAKPQTIDVTALVQWLSDMAALHSQNNGPTVPVLVADKQYALPEPVADMIVQVAAREKVLLKKDRD